MCMYLWENKKMTISGFFKPYIYLFSSMSIYFIYIYYIAYISDHGEFIK